MLLDLTVSEVDSIQEDADHHCPPVMSSDGLETIHTMSSQLGYGYSREIKLSSGLELSIFYETHPNGLIQRIAENHHLVQFMVHLSGVVDSDSFLYQDSTQSYIGGSGIQQALTSVRPANQLLAGVDIHLQPHLLSQLFAAPTGELPSGLQPLVQGNDWQRVFSPKVTSTIRAIVQQIIDCPFLGTTKRLYLQGKVFELMALQLDEISGQGKTASSSSLKADTISRIHYAAEILRSQLENPPQQTILAQQVGISDRTLQKGFKAVFGVTPFAYLTQQRMKQAKHLLQCADYTVAEVANMVGYANPAQFSAAFKRQLGMTPHKCFGYR